MAPTLFLTTAAVQMIFAAVRENCFDFGHADFSPVNSVAGRYNSTMNLELKFGDKFLDFGLLRPVTVSDGQTNRTLVDAGTSIAKLLHERPVVLINGAWSDPYFHLSQNGNYRAEADFTEGYSFKNGMVFVVHVYTVEPYPSLPWTSFGTGLVTPTKFSIAQPRTFAARAARVRSMLKSGMLHNLTYVAIDPFFDPEEGAGGRDETLPDQHLLGPCPNNKTACRNPIFCSYGQAPRGAWLINTNGVIEYTQSQFDADLMADKVDAMGLQVSLSSKALLYTLLPIVSSLVVVAFSVVRFYRRKAREARFNSSMQNVVQNLASDIDGRRRTEPRLRSVSSSDVAHVVRLLGRAAGVPVDGTPRSPVEKHHALRSVPAVWRPKRRSSSSASAAGFEMAAISSAELNASLLDQDE